MISIAHLQQIRNGAYVAMSLANHVYLMGFAFNPYKSNSPEGQSFLLGCLDYSNRAR